MKTIIIVFFTAASALLAAETNSPAPTLLTNAVPALQIPIVEQAELVRQIGEEAAKGFDAETHARELRAQLEAFLTKPVVKPAASVDAVEATPAQLEPTAKPSATASLVTVPAANANTSATGPDPAALKEAIRILRAEADRLEAQFHKLSRQP